jgi:hypothetical protein
MSVTGSIIAGVGLAGSVGSAAIGASAAGNAASEQAQASEQAAQLQYQASQNALGFQETQYNQGQQNLQPWLQSGAGALSNLDYLEGISPYMSGQVPSGQSSFSPTQFNATPPGGQPLSPSGASGSTLSPTSGFNAGSTFGGMPIQQAYGGSIAANPIQGTSGAFGATPNLTPTPSSLGGSNMIAANPTQGTSGDFGAQPTAGSNMVATNPANRLTGTSGINPTQTKMPAQQAYGALNGTPAMGPSGLNSPIPASNTPVANGYAPSSTSSGGYGSLLQPYPGQFTAPTAQQALNSPGEQAQLQLGQQALEQSAAARGNVLTGGTAQAENQLAQNYASTNYQNVYNDAFNTYSQGYNQYEQNQANQYNRLASLAGVGQTAAGQLGTLGSNAASGVSSNLLGTASAIGQDTQNAAAANASGVVGAANAYSGAIGNAGSSLSQLALLQQLGGSTGGGGGYQGDSSIYDTLT